MATSSTARRVLITGGNAGIGFELARQLLSKGHEVLLACRDLQRANTAAETLNKGLPQQQQQQVGVVHCDLADLSTVRECASKVQQQWSHLDILVCNAAIITAQQETTVDGLNTMFQVNHVGHSLLIQLLLPALTKSDDGRIVMVTSELAQRVQPPLDEPGVLYPNPTSSHTGMGLYPHTKLLNIWFTRQLAKQLPPNVTVNAVCPGFAPTTGLGRHVQGRVGAFMMRYVLPLFPFTVTVEEAARRVGSVCLLPKEPRVTGQVFSKGQQAVPSAAGADDAKAAQLRQLTEQALAQAASRGKAPTAAAAGATAAAVGSK